MARKYDLFRNKEYHEQRICELQKEKEKNIELDVPFREYLNHSIDHWINHHELEIVVIEEVGEKE